MQRRLHISPEIIAYVHSSENWAFTFYYVMAIEFAYIYFVYHLSSCAKIANNRCKWILRSECMLYRKPYRKKNVNRSSAKFYNNVYMKIIDIIFLLMKNNESMIFMIYIGHNPVTWMVCIDVLGTIYNGKYKRIFGEVGLEFFSCVLPEMRYIPISYFSIL